jgi:hypothetical protein
MHVLAHQLRFEQRLDLVDRLARARDMHGDGNAEPARILELGPVDFRRNRPGAELAAPRHAERDQAVVRTALPVLGERFERRLVGHLGVGHALRPTAGMPGADADLRERAHVGFGMRGAAHVVAPGMNVGGAGIDRLGCGEPGALEHVVRGHLRAEPRDGREIALLRLVTGETAIERVPHVPVGLDEAGHDDHAVAVDPQAAAGDVLADRDDVAVAHMDGPAGDVAERRVHGHHIGVGDGELTARRQRSAAARLRHQRRRPQRAGACRAEGGDAAEETAPCELVHEPLPELSAAADRCWRFAWDSSKGASRPHQRQRASIKNFCGVPPVLPTCQAEPASRHCGCDRREEATGRNDSLSGRIVAIFQESRAVLKVAGAATH